MTPPPPGSSSIAHTLCPYYLESTLMCSDCDGQSRENVLFDQKYICPFHRAHAQHVRCIANGSVERSKMFYSTASAGAYRVRSVFKCAPKPGYTRVLNQTRAAAHKRYMNAHTGIYFTVTHPSHITTPASSSTCMHQMIRVNTHTSTMMT